MVIFFIFEINYVYNSVSVFPHPVPLKFPWLASADLSFSQCDIQAHPTAVS